MKNGIFDIWTLHASPVLKQTRAAACAWPACPLWSTRTRWHFCTW